MKIGTHDGVFHCDEVLACCMLKCLPEYTNAAVIRTADAEKLCECNILLDVGGEFDHAKKRYDNQYNRLSVTLSSLRPELGMKYQIRLSCAGLVYAHYGEKLIKQLAPKGIQITDDNLIIIFKRVYENFVQEIDAVDKHAIERKYSLPSEDFGTSLNYRIYRLNPEWNSTQNKNSEELFEKAIGIVRQELMDNILYVTSVWLPAREYVKSAFQNRSQIHASCKIIELPKRMPWHDHLLDVEEEMGKQGEILFVVFKDKRNSWIVQCVPISSVSLKKRKPFLYTWWGRRDKTLSDATGIEGSVFCDRQGYTAGNVTREGAIKMAEAAVTYDIMKDYGEF